MAMFLVAAALTSIINLCECSPCYKKSYWLWRL